MRWSTAWGSNGLGPKRRNPAMPHMGSPPEGDSRVHQDRRPGQWKHADSFRHCSLMDRIIGTGFERSLNNGMARGAGCLRRRQPGRNEELEASAAERGGRYQNVAAVCTRHAPEDRKPESEPFLSGASLRAPEKRVEDALAVRARDPGPRVLHHDGTPPGPVEDPDADALPRRGELEGVREQVADRRRQERGMTPHQDFILGAEIEIPGALPLHVAEFAVQVPDEVAEIDRLGQLAARWPSRSISATSSGT